MIMGFLQPNLYWNFTFWYLKNSLKGKTMKGTNQILIIWVLFLPIFATAQQEDSSDIYFSTGLLIDNEAFEQNVEMIPEYSNDGRRAADLPRKFSLRVFTPYPKNQGSINSCIGWAMGYAALTTQKAFSEGITNRKKITDNAHSALYIYNQVKEGSCLAGAYVDKAAVFLKENGTCLSSEFDFPYSDCDRQPAASLVAKSQEYVVKDFIGLFKKDDNAKVKVMRTKRSIAEGKPVVIGMRIKESLKTVSNQSPLWKPGGEYDKELGGHALCVVGYNDSLGVFEIMNSWGIAWGDNGFFRISYRDYSEQTFQGIQLILPDVELSASEKLEIEKRKEIAFNKLEKARNQRSIALQKKEKAEQALKIAETVRHTTTEAENQKNADALLQEAESLLESAKAEAETAKNIATLAEATIVDAELTNAALAGDFLVRMPVTDEFGTLMQDEEGEFIFKELSPVWVNDHYEILKKNWEEGDMFQVIVKNIKKDSYVYLFSLDGLNKAEIHWPRNQKFEEHIRGYDITGKGEGALVAHSGAEIVIPGNDAVLVRENLSDDHIVVLYSDIRIDDFKERVIRLKTETQGDFQDRFKATFGDILIPLEQIEFSTDVMRIRAATLNDGKVIPVVVKISNE